ncbi:hypothetical protein Leryth_016103 [Lithospermum erythrorhizon]|nr:hypothetical protein Leryth_016103 [Lithospermum erythrorhizon]
MASTSPMNTIEIGHQMYREGKYENALGYYTEALSTAKTKPQIIALHSNRAACYLKLHDFKKAALECTWVLELDQNHTGALMLRAQTLVTLKDYQSALFDVNRLIELNPVSEVYQNLQARLKSQLSLAPIPEAEAEFEEEDEDRDEEELEEEPRKDYNEADLEEEKNEVVNHAVELGVDDAETCKAREQMGRTEKIIANEPLPNLQKETLASVNSKAEAAFSQAPNIDKSLDLKPLDFQTVGKPKGHSRLDYSKWDTVEDSSSEDEDDEDEYQPQYRFRVKNVGVRAVK